MLMPFTVSRRTSAARVFLHPDEPAHERYVGQRSGRAPDTDKEVAHALGAHRLARLDQIEGEPADRPLQRKKHGRERSRDQQRAREGGSCVVEVVGTVGLGGESGGAHAQEVAAEIERVEDEGTDRDRAEKVRLRQVADDGGVDRAQQGDRQVGNDHRPGQAPDTAVPGPVTHQRRPRGHAAPGAQRCERGLLRGSSNTNSVGRSLILVLRRCRVTVVTSPWASVTRHWRSLGGSASKIRVRLPAPASSRCTRVIATRLPALCERGHDQILAEAKSSPA